MWWLETGMKCGNLFLEVVLTNQGTLTSLSFGCWICPRFFILAFGPRFEPKTPATNRKSWCLGLEVGSECEDVRFVAGVLGSQRCPNAKTSICWVSWARSEVRMLKLYCCRFLGLEAGPECQDVRFVAGVLGSNRVRMLRCTICCRCLGLEGGFKCEDVRFVSNVLGSKRGPDAKMYDLLPVSWARSGARMLRRTICCRCLGLEAEC